MSTSANNTGFPFEGNQDSSLNKKRKWFKRPWKQSYRKIPISIDTKLNQFKGGAIKVASAREVPVHQIQQGFLPLWAFILSPVICIFQNKTLFLH